MHIWIEIFNTAIRRYSINVKNNLIYFILFLFVATKRFVYIAGTTALKE